MDNYFGPKGYSIYKKSISVVEQEKIRRELTVLPYVPKSSITRPDSFPIYRESEDKIYIPRHFGLDKYGEPQKNKLKEGIDIDIEFKGTLRPFQEVITKKYVDVANKIGGGLLDVPCGFGKCLSKNTPIIMYDGSIKMVQDIKVGDQLMGDDSTPRNVLTLARGREMMYDIIPTKGDKYTVNESHILSLKCSSTHSKKYRKGEIYDISVEDYLNLPKCFHGRGGSLLGYRVPIIFPKKDVDIEPYFLGCWLGDGSNRNLGITNIDEPIINYCYEYSRKLKLDIRICDSKGTRCPTYFITSHNKKPNSLVKFFHKYKLFNNKHIPLDFKCNDRQTQLELLAGIIDSDGSLKCKCYDIIQKNEQLLDDIIYLAKSLGFAAYKNVCKKSCIYKGEKREGTYYRTTIHGKGLEEIPVKCERKKCTPRKQIKDALVTRIKVIKKEEDDYYGFELDGNHRYVLGDFTVTHNTVIALNIISKLKKKTLVIVHKEFLVNQWIERIEEFLPTARIGKIQGQIVDVDDKDIVIGMLQSLSMKEYPVTLFANNFGLTTFDECHHIAAEVFSRALFKIVTKYMLGLSATMNRKDGLTKVFKMFIGPIFHTEKRDSDDNVLVRKIVYENDDEEFNKTTLNFKGQVHYSMMIKKVCEFSFRTEFILKVLEKLLLENKEQQIMILAHNKSILNYLYKAIETRNMASVGYYIGGMKEQDLKISETKKVVIATFAMAEEALDIKTLSTLILASPKTDVTQAVGRILRIKHKQPLVIDIVDKHDIFQRQWIKRQKFYVKQKYRIDTISSSQFNNNNYENLYNPLKSSKVKKDKSDKPTLENVGKCLIKIKT